MFTLSSRGNINETQIKLNVVSTKKKEYQITKEKYKWKCAFYADTCKNDQFQWFAQLLTKSIAHIRYEIQL